MNDQKAREMLGANDCCIYRIWFVASAAAKTMVNVVSKCCLGLFYCVFHPLVSCFFLIAVCIQYLVVAVSFVVKNIVVVVAVAAVAVVVVVFVVCCLLFNVCCQMFLV